MYLFLFLCFLLDLFSFTSKVPIGSRRSLKGETGHKKVSSAPPKYLKDSETVKNVCKVVPYSNK